jgi:hypothetical protein
MEGERRRALMRALTLAQERDVHARLSDPERLRRRLQQTVGLEQAESLYQEIADARGARERRIDAIRRALANVGREEKS